MVNGIILTLVNSGILNITSNDFPRNDEGNKAAYRVYKFKKAVENAFKGLQESEKGLLETAGIDAPETFDSRRAELRAKEDKTAEETKELEDMTAQLEKYVALRNELYNEEAKLEVLPISWSMWRLLLEENKAKKIGENEVDILSPLESVLEGILWEGAKE